MLEAPPSPTKFQGTESSSKDLLIPRESPKAVKVESFSSQYPRLRILSVSFTLSAFAKIFPAEAILFQFKQSISKDSLLRSATAKVRAPTVLNSFCSNSSTFRLQCSSLNASAIALAPLAPILLLFIFSVAKDLLRKSSLAMASHPSSPISFISTFRSVQLSSPIIADTTASAPMSPIISPPRSTVPPCSSSMLQRSITFTNSGFENSA
mmetsp:Transcript_1174/g.1391  ORF Transcript_1174/g.1391 Transcript_1174/m.1391 type:complete len:209 (+) Transcript_1174:1554-2180(+)